jgi:hypothetical protein
MVHKFDSKIKLGYKEQIEPETRNRNQNRNRNRNWNQNRNSSLDKSLRDKMFAKFIASDNNEDNFSEFLKK